MKITTNLEDIRRAVTLCIRCNMCTYSPWPDNFPLCPLYLSDKCFTFGPGGLAYIARGILEGHLDYNPPMAELAFTCAGCGACDNLCHIIPFPPPHASLSEIVRLLRYELVKKGLIPEGKTREIYLGIKERGDYLDGGDGLRLKIPQKIKGDQADTVLYAECFHSPTQKEIYESALKILEKLGKPIALFADGGCCGSTLYDLGFWGQVGKLVEAKWEKMKPLVGKEILFLNPHCQEFVVKKYPEIQPNYEEMKTKHFSQFLVDEFKKGNLKSKKMSRVKVTYHDPCYLGRGLGIYEPPRQTLDFLDGVERIEMKQNRANTLCCGARATANYFPKFAENIAEKKLEAFRATGADLLITSCPYCKEAFQKVMVDKDKGRVKDLTELVEERIK
jgi:heterodisulfide reductase subunit D